MLKLKSGLLIHNASKWHYQDKLYTGIVFFEKEDYQLEAYEVKNGEIIKPYISPCQIGLPSPIQIQDLFNI